jgi:hypothetical protein
MLAAGKQGGENTQIHIREQPAFRLPASGSGSAHKGPQMFAAGNIAKMLGANSRQTRNLVFGENFLGGFNSDHSSRSSAVPVTGLSQKE